MKSSIRLNFCQAYNDLGCTSAKRFKYLCSVFVCILALNISSAVTAQTDQQDSDAKNLSRKMNIVISASSAIAVDQFYGKALGLQRLPDLLVDNAYPIMRYQLEDSALHAELHFVIAREKLPKLKGGANVARGIRLLSINFPQENKNDVLRRLHITARNPILEAKTFVNGDRYDAGSIVDADGNQIQIQFVDNKRYSNQNDRFRVGLLVDNKKAATKAFDKILKTLSCETHLVDNCGLQNFAMQIFQASDGLEVWSATPNEKIGFSLMQIQINELRSKYQKFSKDNPEFTLSELSNVSTTGLKVRDSFLLAGPNGILIEFFENESVERQ